MIGHELSGREYANMLNVAARNLNRYIGVVNDLNVFPIPDGDTGDNMMMTLKGGVNLEVEEEAGLSEVSLLAAKGMLLNARGNSGVILSQFFAGIADGFDGLEVADTKAIEEAFQKGVKRAYESVMTPTEGTILTVAKEATLAACNAKCEDPEGFMGCFVDSAKVSLEKTPEKLKVLKDAGVVDSGGAGLVYIAEGMRNYLTGEYDETEVVETENVKAPVSYDLDAFGPDMELQYGYCTETLLRLQSSKCDYKSFDVNIIRDFLQTIGNSIVCIKDDSIVKLHVHTMHPQMVLDFCQKYGEFLTIKIENMMLQHNNLDSGAASESEKDLTPKTHSRYAVVTVANGEGINDDFTSMGADEVIFGGQTMNPSTEDFLQSFDRANADDIFVLPNNGNIILAAKQAASLYEKSNIHVVPTKTIGDAYAVLSMLDYSSEDANEVYEGMLASMEGVKTAEVSVSIRDAELNGVEIHKDDYLSIMSKQVLSAAKDIDEVLKETVDKMKLEEHGLFLIVTGKDADSDAVVRMEEYVSKKYPLVEVASSEGKQDVYPYILVAE